MVPNYANLVMFCLQAAGDSVVAIIIIIFLAWTNPYALVFLLVIAGISLVGFDLLVRKRMTRIGQHANLSAAAIVKHTNESIRGFKEIRVLKQEDYFKDNLIKDAKVFAFTQTTINFFSMLPKYIFEMIIIIFCGGGLCFRNICDRRPSNLNPNTRRIRNGLNPDYAVGKELFIHP